ncbi:hypothetical protein LSCM1_03860 [Leishmania martiniquensis]|uniref:peptidyl-tRNA hydrolase n=1 Tax=Leishmania martiniquensis TaxID=1580590 RepID=A0A836KFT6_9TRYP|nr:hypothetical protein LSCM1_03860 [Leishmania martiniquensis]
MLSATTTTIITDSVLDETAWAPACLAGALLGCALALLCTALLQWRTSSRAAPKEAAATSALSRRDRAAKSLEELRRTSATAAAADRAHAAGPTAADKGSWESTTTGTSDEDSSRVDADYEYEQMEALRLKMVFVVRSGVQPKLTTQEMVVLVASAGIQLVELIQKQPSLSPVSSASASASLCSVESQHHHCWRRWYLWWNRVGCGKITLRCPDKEKMELIVAAAQERGLPMAQLRRLERAAAEGAQIDRLANSTDAVCVALGPAPSDVLEPITGSLKLFS